MELRSSMLANSIRSPEPGQKRALDPTASQPVTAHCEPDFRIEKYPPTIGLIALAVSPAVCHDMALPREKPGNESLKRFKEILRHNIRRRFKMLRRPYRARLQHPTICVPLPPRL
jgi:hypothetical protein